MKIVYLEAAINDLIWVRTYYTRVFPEGAKRARIQIQATERLLLENPGIGHSLGIGTAREFPILRTPFSIIYRLTSDRIEILRVWDQRGDPAVLVFEPKR